MQSNPSSNQGNPRGTDIKRWLIIVVCVVLVSIKLLKDEAEVDISSAWLISVSVILFFWPEFMPFIKRLTKIKFGSLEAELRDEIEKIGLEAENLLSDDQSGSFVDASNIDYTERQVQDVIKEISSDPRAALLLLHAKIEHELRKRLREYDVKDERQMRSLRGMVNLASQLGILSNNVVFLFNDFGSVRNMIAHHANGMEIDDATVIGLIDVGIKLLRIVTEPRQQESDQK